MVTGKKKRYSIGFVFLILFALVFFSDTLLGFLFGAGTNLSVLFGWGMGEAFSYGIFLSVFMLVCITLGIYFIVAALLYIENPGASQQKNPFYKNVHPLLLVLLGLALFLVVHFDIGLIFLGVKIYLKFFSALLVLVGIWGFLKRLSAKAPTVRP